MKRDANALMRLLQLASPALPVGAYSYSQGLEAAVEAGIVRDAPSAASWIGDVMALSLATMEGPLLVRLMAASSSGDMQALQRWNDEMLASRESAELRAETAQMGYSMRRLLVELDVPDAASLAAFEEISFPTAFAFAASAWKIEAEDALAAYLWSWLENQVMAALKSVPLGQTDGQRTLLALGARIPDLVQIALHMSDDDLVNFAPGLAILSARHETQYTRLFRS
jgi:urease accessory protein